MVLALILRNSTRISVFSNILKGTVVKAEPRKWFTQFSKEANKPKFPKICSAVTKFDVPKRLMSANHAKFWPFEKLVTVLLLGVVPATFLYPNPILDDIFAAMICLHMHWGLEACVVDYVRPIILGSLIPKLTLVLLYLVTLGTLSSLIYYNHNDIGIGRSFQKFWELTGCLDD